MRSILFIFFFLCSSVSGAIFQSFIRGWDTPITVTDVKNPSSGWYDNAKSELIPDVKNEWDTQKRLLDYSDDDYQNYQEDVDEDFEFYEDNDENDDNLNVEDGQEESGKDSEDVKVEDAEDSEDVDDDKKDSEDQKRKDADTDGNQDSKDVKDPENQDSEEQHTGKPPTTTPESTENVEQDQDLEETSDDVDEDDDYDREREEYDDNEDDDDVTDSEEDLDGDYIAYVDEDADDYDKELEESELEDYQNLEDIFPLYEDTTPLEDVKPFRKQFVSDSEDVRMGSGEKPENENRIVGGRASRISNMKKIEESFISLSEIKDSFLRFFGY